jgi:hypothetical protein
MELQVLRDACARRRTAVQQHQRAAVSLRRHHPCREGPPEDVAAIGVEHEPVPPALVDAEAALVPRVRVRERQRDVVPGVPVEPEPRAGEHSASPG